MVYSRGRVLLYLMNGILGKVFGWIKRWVACILFEPEYDHPVLYLCDTDFHLLNQNSFQSIAIYFDAEANSLLYWHAIN